MYGVMIGRDSSSRIRRSNSSIFFSVSLTVVSPSATKSTRLSPCRVCRPRMRKPSQSKQRERHVFQKPFRWPQHDPECHPEPDPAHGTSRQRSRVASRHSHALGPMLIFRRADVAPCHCPVLAIARSVREYSGTYCLTLNATGCVVGSPALGLKILTRSTNW